MEIGYYKDVDKVIKDRTLIFINSGSVNVDNKIITLDSVLLTLINRIDDLPYAIYFTETFNNDLLEILNLNIDLYLEYFNDLSLGLKMNGIDIDEILTDITNSISNINKDAILTRSHRELTNVKENSEQERTLKGLIVLVKFHKHSILKIIESVE